MNGEEDLPELVEKKTGMIRRMFVPSVSIETIEHPECPFKGV